MSDFLFSTRRRADGELWGALARYLAPVSAVIEERHGPWGSLAVARGPHDPPEVVVEEGGWISVLVGDPVVRIGPEPPALSRLGARRRAVHALLRGGADGRWDERMDSGFAALAIETERGGGTVVTDLGAFVPVFAARTDDAWIAGTHLDAVARAAGRREIDPVSAADLLAHLTCTYPHTLYRGVEQLPPASAVPFAPGGAPGEPLVYWRPVEENPYASVRDAAAALRDALVEQTGAVCRGLPEVALLLSGGEDARAVLGAVPREVRVRAFVFADWENREVRVARAAAEAYGATLAFGRRAPDHYVDGLEAVAGMIGGHNLFMDVHGWGLHERLALRDFAAVLGGLSSDSFLKAEHAPRRANADEWALPPASLIRRELLEEVVARRLAFRRWLAEFRPATAAEWEKLWPFTQRTHGANFHGNRRMFASQEPYHANAIVKLAAAVPTEWKRHRRLFHAAMKPLFRRSWAVPHARWRYPYFGAAANLPLAAALRVSRGVRDLVAGELRTRQAPWPKWRTVAHSEAAAVKLYAYGPWDPPLGGLFRDASRGVVLDSIRGEWHPLRQLILLQLAYLARRAAED